MERHKVPIASTLIFFVAVLFCGSAQSNPAPFKCAVENEMCQCTGTVRYGKGNLWTAPMPAEGEIACKNEIFGDPIFGTVKECVCNPSGCTDTSLWTNNHGENCEAYAQYGYCENGMVKPGKNFTLGAFYNFPENNCCVCGKSQGYTEVELTCSSNGYQYTTCDAGGVIHDITLKEQLSSSACREDESFGFSGSDIWVDNGCRASFNVQLQESLVYYESISGKSCTEATTTSKNLAYSNCNGWARTNLESCKQKCINNELPSGCPTHSFSCKFVKWDDNKDWPPGWCQVADSNCVLSSAVSDCSNCQTLELKKEDTPTAVPTIAPESDRQRFLYRVSNNGATGWRPSVRQIQVFSNQGCSKETLATYIDEVGHNSGFGDGSAAFDNKTRTKWRPQCLNCTRGEAWITFSTIEEARCIIATNLGKGRIGNKTWNGGIDVIWNHGILVELKNPDGSWMKIMESFRDNSAVIGTCPTGYQRKVGHVPGGGGDLGSALNLTGSECALRCNELDVCLSYEHSDTEMKCNLNSVSEPTTDAYEDFIFCIKVVYERLSSGTCASLARSSVETKEECEFAAAKLGLSATNAYSSQTKGRPQGCIYATNDRLQWNDPFGYPYPSVPCGKGDSVDYDCLCSKQDQCSHCYVRPTTTDGPCKVPTPFHYGFGNRIQIAHRLRDIRTCVSQTERYACSRIVGLRRGTYSEVCYQKEDMNVVSVDWWLESEEQKHEKIPSSGSLDSPKNGGSDYVYVPYDMCKEMFEGWTLLDKNTRNILIGNAKAHNCNISAYIPVPDKPHFEDRTIWFEIFINLLFGSVNEF